MQQRQLRLGDILDDYCPRERRVTNHAVVAMIGDDVKQTRCTTCDAEHEYKHAKVPRQRRKPETPAALVAQQAAGTPKRVPHEHENPQDSVEQETSEHSAATTSAVEEDVMPEEPLTLAAEPASSVDSENDGESSANEPDSEEEGPVHRPLIRATLPRLGNQPPAPRPAPEFTIRQPGGRQNRFRQRQGGGGQQFFGNRSNGNQGGGRQQGGGWNARQQDGQRSRRHGQGHKRSK
jgi:hypothetical protein